MSFDEWLKTKPAGTPIRARDAWNASRADSRAEALKEAIGVVHWKCQPNHGSLFAEIDEEICALAASPKPRGEG